MNENEYFLVLESKYGTDYKIVGFTNNKETAEKYCSLHTGKHNEFKITPLKKIDIDN